MAASFIGGLIVSAVALYFAFKNVPLAELFNYLVSINYFWILPAVAIVFLSFLLRALRWPGQGRRGRDCGETPACARCHSSAV